MPPEALEAELSPDTVIGGFMDLSLHIFSGREKPACMAEIGLIREREFRASGAGRNVPRDIDSLDTSPGSYLQLAAWDPVNREIVSMYRFAEAAKIIDRFGPGALRTSSLFTFSGRFLEEMLPRSIELGRSVVNRRARRAVAGLFAIWCGLGILVREHEEADFFFGNVTLTNAVSSSSRDALLSFLNRFYSSPEERAMVKARPGMEYEYSQPEYPFSADPASARRELIDLFSRRKESVPPIILSYLGAAERFTIFDTARDGDFGDAWEIAIAVPFDEINIKTRRRFLDGYERTAGGYFDNSGSY
jgi:hypothetical protein